jgi:predicted TIM-barrel fold metal-dependent hydrolase
MKTRRLLPAIVAALFVLSSPIRADSALELHPTCGTDMHMHIHAPTPDDEMPFDGARAQLALEGAKLARGVVLSHAYIARNNPACWVDSSKPCPVDRKWTEATNDWTLSQAAASNHSLIPFCGIDPHASWAIEEVQRCKRIGMRGLKIHTQAAGLSLQNPLDREMVRKVVEAAGVVHLPVLIHANFPSENESKALLSLVEETPNTIFILGHMMGKYFALLNKFHPKNAYIEGSAYFIALSRSKPAELVATVRAFGVDRVLFGSDWPVFHPSETLARIRNTSFTDDEIDQMVCRNPKMLFHDDN